MSYSFSVQAADKDAALQAVKDQMAAVVKDQPVHARDERFVNDSAASAVAILDADASKDVMLSIYGSLSWNGGSEPGKEELTRVSIGVDACLNVRAAKPEA